MRPHPSRRSAIGAARQERLAMPLQSARPPQRRNSLLAPGNALICVNAFDPPLGPTGGRSQIRNRQPRHAYRRQGRSRHVPHLRRDRHLERDRQVGKSVVKGRLACCLCTPSAQMRGERRRREESMIIAIYITVALITAAASLYFA